MVKKTVGKRSGNPNPKPLPAGPGRPKGLPNKLSGLAKDNIAAVFDQLGGINNMVLWAKDNATDFYRIYARLLPVQVEGNPDNPIGLNLQVQFVSSDNKDT